jgi:heme/copper-type cytochrome/quinol oxidase subunit 1
MHFLGLAGMPRRIPDYPDIYLYYNQIATLGSILTLFSFIYFVLSLTSGRLYSNTNKSSKEKFVPDNKNYLSTLLVFLDIKS